MIAGTAAARKGRIAELAAILEFRRKAYVAAAKVRSAAKDRRYRDFMTRINSGETP